MMRGYLKWLMKKISKENISNIPSLLYGHLTCFSEHMQTFNYLTSMLPIVEEMCDTKEEQKGCYADPLRPQPATTLNHNLDLLL